MNRTRVLVSIAALLSVLSVSHAPANGDTEKGNLCYDMAWKTNRSGRSEEALNSINKALVFDPNSAKYNWYKSVILYNLDEQEEALVFATKALQLDPKYYLGWCDRGNILIKLGRYDEAIKDLQKAISLHSDPGYFLILGNAMLYEKRWADAKRQFDRSIELEPRDPSPYNQRALCEAQLGQWADVVKDTSINMKSVSYGRKRGSMLLRAQAYAELKDIARARQAFRECCEQFPDDPSMHRNARAFYERIGDLKMAAAENLAIKRIESEY